jgi:hypothetical protein
MIPKKYYKSCEEHPTASSVGELKSLLAELPDNLPIESGWGTPVRLVVYNHGKPSQHLELVEPYDPFDEDDEG